jgi:hypothetical protein
MDQLRAQIRAIVELEPLIGRDPRFSPAILNRAVDELLSDVSVLESVGPTETLKTELIQLANGTPALQHWARSWPEGTKIEYADFYAHMRQLGELFSLTLLESVQSYASGDEETARKLAAVALRIYAEAYLSAGLNLGDRRVLFAETRRFTNAASAVPSLFALLGTAGIMQVTTGAYLTDPHSAMLAGTLAAIAAAVPGLVLRWMNGRQEAYKPPTVCVPSGSHECTPYDRQIRANMFPDLMPGFVRERVLGDTFELGLAQFHHVVERNLVDATVEGTNPNLAPRQESLRFSSGVMSFLSGHFARRLPPDNDSDEPELVAMRNSQLRMGIMRALSDLAGGSLQDIFPSRELCAQLLGRSGN